MGLPVTFRVVPLWSPLSYMAGNATMPCAPSNPAVNHPDAMLPSGNDAPLRQRQPRPGIAANGAVCPFLQPRHGQDTAFPQISFTKWHHGDLFLVNLQIFIQISIDHGRTDRRELEAAYRRGVRETLFHQPYRICAQRIQKRHVLSPRTAHLQRLQPLPVRQG